MITIPLSKGYVALVDDEDADLAERNWWYSSGYAKRHGGRPRRESIYLHREVAKRQGNVVGMDVDHINGDSLDNRRANLRIVTHAENVRNLRGAKKHSRSGVLGVRQQKSGRWLAYICEGTRRIDLGTFDTPEEASTVRTAAERERYGIQPRRAWAHA